MSLPLAALLPWAALALPAAGAPKKAPKKATYADVAPILKAHCNSCHSGTNLKAGLDLATVKGLKAGGINGDLVVPGKPAKSLLLARVKGHGGKPMMPLGFAPLTAAQIKTIEDWIASGASYAAAPKPHWAYVAPVRPAVPTVKRAAWVRNPIDAFVMARLEKGQLPPSPEAPKETLLRRVSLDLTGIPPTPAEIDAFLADDRPDAYERVVDRLMASPHYGERQAQIWLDLARYADSDGYEKDLRRTIWKYRDWLIEALNKNVPYDQFTVEQLAGDLLPNATQDQLIATGFNRNTLMNLEGGVDQEEAHFKVVLDRVDTTSTVWLGSTIACARCHDHKYDPWSHKDYYRLAAFFNNAAIYPRGPKEVSEEKWYEADMEVPTPEQAARKKALTEELARHEAVLTNWTPEVRAEYDDWRARVSATVAWRPATLSATAQSGATITAREDKSFLVSGPVPERDVYTLKGTANLQGARALRLEALADPSLPAKGPGRAGNGNFVLNRVTLTVGGKPVAFRVSAADFVQNEFDTESVITGDDRKGWAINGQNGRSHELVLEFAEPVTTAGDVPIEITMPQAARHGTHVLGAFRVSFTDGVGAAATVMSPDMRALATKPNPTPEDEKRVRAFFASQSRTLAPARMARAKAEMDLASLRRQVPTTLVMRDKPAKGPLTMALRTRGEFLNPAEVQRANTPAILPAMAKTLPGNRLGLAKWIVDKSNPLTARVQVNRMWESAFGRGIVETSEDFGTQGSRPSHPELLDWLATEFMANGWDMKAMHRLIVTSATYRQSSVASRPLRARDPDNVLLARGPRFRLDAEGIRDVSLAAAGLLSPKIGGPSVFPYQPDGTWDTPYSGETWETSMGEDAHRRGMYTFWKRSATFPGFMAFDATSREACTVRRIRTNTPLQALAQLNDRGMFDAARALARRMKEEGGPDTAARLAYGFRLCTARRPKPDEVKRLVDLVERVRTRYEKDAESAKKIKATPEEAAYTMAANVLLNLDETVTKG
ncbi:MAG: PSD1 and planctomycete cytochrome C domain-containing protein [Fimbriimonas sp.]